MATNLVIVESPAKARTINKILGQDFLVKASMGHVRDLPAKGLGIDLNKDFKPTYVTIKGHEKVVKELRAAAGAGKAVYLAPDPDREGEAIAWHLKAALEGTVPDDKFFRVTYNEITPRAIREAFSKPRGIDIKLVNAQQARRLLDRLVGFKVSPLLWQRVSKGLSAGRVQSVALRILCEREDEIAKFVPEAYWLVGARVRKQAPPPDPFEIRLARIDGEKAQLKSREQVDGIRADLAERRLKVSKIVRRDISKKAYPPYITSTLQQAGSNVFGFAPARTMQIAQHLFEGVDLGDGPVGLITYMRTDSVAISEDARRQGVEFIATHYGKEYLPESPNIYRSRSGAQEAHEAIRPTDVQRTPDAMAARLQPDELKIYRLIWQRFVASQMAPARIAQRTAEIETLPHERHPASYLFRVSASDIVFPGYMKVAGIEKSHADNDEEPVVPLPPLQEGEPLDVLEWLDERKETQPPNRYSEAALIKALEEHGIGRPSTYAQIISTLHKRRYAVRDKKILKPTDLGRQVNQFLVEHLEELFNVKFTAAMEESLDAIDQGAIEWTAMLKDFYARFSAWLSKARGPGAEAGNIRRLLALFEPVTQWGPESKRGKRTYGDRLFVTSIQKQLDDDKRPLSERQEQALVRIAMRYKEQIPELEPRLTGWGYASLLKPSEQNPEQVRRKIELLRPILPPPTEPLVEGQRNDNAFFDSLRRQAEEGKTLSYKQVLALDRLLMKFSTRIPDFEQLRADLGIQVGHTVLDSTCGPLLELLKDITDWKPAVQRGKREWDDRSFYQSLSRQFGEKGGLSPRQAASLKKMLRRYADQIPRYEELRESLNLLPRVIKKSRDKAEAADAPTTAADEV